jgi:arabinofuranosyltransferase
VAIRSEGGEAERTLPGGERAGILFERSRVLAGGLPLLLIALYTVVLIRTAWVCDDAFITLRTVDNFVHGYGLRWNVAERVQAYTHPLWMLLLSIPYFMTREAFYTTAFLSIAVSIAAFAVLMTRSRISIGARVACGIMLLCSRSFIDYSTSGLENPLTNLLLVAFLLLWEDEPAGGRAGPKASESPDVAPRSSLRRLTLLSAIAGLAALNRLDSLLLFAPGLALVLLRHGWRRGIRPLATGFAPFALWVGFSLLYYGLPFPNTALAKLNTGIDSLTLVRHGFYYVANSLHNDPGTFTVIALALGAALIRRRARDLAIALGILLYLVYIVKIGGDFMSGRFFAAPFLAGSILLMQMDRLPVRFARPGLAALVVLLGCITPHPPFLTGSRFGIPAVRLIDGHGIADERQYYFPTQGMITSASDWARPAANVSRMGRESRRLKTPLIIEGAVGVTGYFAGPGVHLVDYQALCDPLLSRLPIVNRDPIYDAFMKLERGTEDPQGWRIGHFLRAVPKGYIRTILSGVNSLEDPELRELYSRLTGIVRGPIWSGRRLADIVRLNLGQFDRLVDRSIHPKYTPPPWDEAIALRPDAPELLYRRARQHYENDQVDPALGDLDRAIQIAPVYADALILYGTIRKEKGEIEAAISAWERATASDPEYAPPYVSLGDAFVSLGQPAKAIPVLQKAVDLLGSAEFGPVFALKARAHMLAGENERARALFLQALKARGTPADSAMVLVELGNLAIADHDGPAALAAFDAVARTGRLLEYVDLGRASALSISGRHGEAADAWRAVVDALPDSVAARTACAWNITLAGRPEEAADLLRAGLARRNDPRLWSELSHALLAGAGTPEQALDASRRAVELDPSTRSLTALALAEIATGRRAEALITRSRISDPESLQKIDSTLARAGPASN